MLKRILSTVLLFGMVLSFGACSGISEDTDLSTTDSQWVSGFTGSSETNSITETDDVTDDITDGTSDVPTATGPKNPTIDYPVSYGMNFVILQHSKPETPFGFSREYATGKKVEARLEEVRKRYYCTFELQQVAYGESDFLAEMQTRAYAANSGDILFSDSASIRHIIGIGGDTSLLTDLVRLDDALNFWNTGKWGSITARASMMAGGTFYGVIPNLWPSFSAIPSDVLVYNRQVLSAFHVTDPQEYWERNAWDREAMLKSITSVFDGEKEIYGIHSTMERMVRATILSSGVEFAKIDYLNQDETVEWSFGVISEDSVEALEWLQSSMKTHAKYFNRGQADVQSGRAEALANGNAAFSLLNSTQVFSEVVTQMEDFGIVLWAGKGANTLYGSYEDPLYGVAIPVFAQDAQLSAYLIYDLFAGIKGDKTQKDLISYYRETYFEQDSDVEILFRTKAKNLQHLYPAYGGTELLKEIGAGLLEAESVSSLVKTASDRQKENFEIYAVPNLASLEMYRGKGYFE